MQSVEQWGVFELELHAEPEGNPFTDVDFKARFQHGHRAIIVDGFYDGQKGFSVTEIDGLYTISLRVTANRGQRVWRRTETTSVSTRN